MNNNNCCFRVLNGFMFLIMFPYLLVLKWKRQHQNYIPLHQKTQQDNSNMKLGISMKSYRQIMSIIKIIHDWFTVSKLKMYILIQTSNTTTRFQWPLWFGLEGILFFCKIDSMICTEMNCEEPSSSLIFFNHLYLTIS